MPAFLAGIVVFLKLLPQLIDFIRQLGKLAEAGHHKITLHFELKKFDQAVDKAKETGDTSDLEGMFNPKPADPK